MHVYTDADCNTENSEPLDLTALLETCQEVGPTGDASSGEAASGFGSDIGYYRGIRCDVSNNAVIVSYHPDGACASVPQNVCAVATPLSSSDLNDCLTPYPIGVCTQIHDPDFNDHYVIMEGDCAPPLPLPPAPPPLMMLVYTDADCTSRDPENREPFDLAAYIEGFPCKPYGETNLGASYLGIRCDVSNAVIFSSHPDDACASAPQNERAGEFINAVNTSDFEYCYFPFPLGVCTPYYQGTDQGNDLYVIIEGGCAGAPQAPPPPPAPPPLILSQYSDALCVEELDGIDPTNLATYIDKCESVLSDDDASSSEAPHFSFGCDVSNAVIISYHPDDACASVPQAECDAHSGKTLGEFRSCHFRFPIGVCTLFGSHVTDDVTNETHPLYVKIDGGCAPLPPPPSPPPPSPSPPPPSPSPPPPSPSPPPPSTATPSASMLRVNFQVSGTTSELEEEREAMATDLGAALGVPRSAVTLEFTNVPDSETAEGDPLTFVAATVVFESRESAAEAKEYMDERMASAEEAGKACTRMFTQWARHGRPRATTAPSQCAGQLGCCAGRAQEAQWNHWHSPKQPLAQSVLCNIQIFASADIQIVGTPEVALGEDDSDNSSLTLGIGAGTGLLAGLGLLAAVQWHRNRRQKQAASAPESSVLGRGPPHGSAEAPKGKGMEGVRLAEGREGTPQGTIHI